MCVFVKVGALYPRFFVLTTKNQIFVFPLFPIETTPCVCVCKIALRRRQHTVVYNRFSSTKYVCLESIGLIWGEGRGNLLRDQKSENKLALENNNTVIPRQRGGGGARGRSGDSAEENTR